MNARGSPDTARCKDCKRPLKRPEYAARLLGPVCGGVVRRGRRAAAPKRPVAEVDEQLELISAEEVGG